MYKVGLRDGCGSEVVAAIDTRPVQRGLVRMWKYAEVNVQSTDTSMNTRIVVMSLDLMRFIHAGSIISLCHGIPSDAKCA